MSNEVRDEQPRPAPPFRSRSLRSLRTANPGDDRIFFHNIWFRGHTNPRYAQLLPRLARLDPYLVVCSDRRIVRGVEFRALRATRWIRNRAVFAAARRYRATLTTDIEQIPFIRGPVVVDIDDPRFVPKEVELLSRSNVQSYVVTTEAAAREFEQMGLATPWHVAPQGVDTSAFDPALVRAAAARRRPGELVVGFVTAWLLATDDHDGKNPMYNIDHLLGLWDQIHAGVPNARLWLVGQPSDRIRRRCGGRNDVLVLGRLPQQEAIAHVANFDIALYPRRKSAARHRSVVKVAEYLAAGVPTVAYDLDETRVIDTTKAGIVVRDPASFVDAVRSLATNDALRATTAAHARDAGAALDWTRLAARYEREILDVELPACR